MMVHIISLPSLLALIFLLILPQSLIRAVDWCGLACVKKELKNTVCKLPKCATDGCDPVPATRQEKDEILDLHNAKRDQFAKEKGASDMMALSYEMQLEYVAQCHANECVFAHDDCRTTPRFPWKPHEKKQGVGQNIYLWTTNRRKSTSKMSIDAMDGWYNEIVDVKSEDIYKKYASTNEGEPQIGHFTQLVWAQTTHVGCAWSEKPLDDKKVKQFLICNYGPSGNTINWPIYTPGQPASNCPSGVERNEKYTGLCGESLKAGHSKAQESATSVGLVVLIVLVMVQVIR